MTAVRTVLLTGASGVIGTALIPELAPAHVVALTHRTPCPGATESVPGDITAPRLGLAPAVYASLAARVDAVVHCAAHTGFSGGRQITENVNVTGTREVIAFAADAGAPLYYVSTAFVARTELTRQSLGCGSGDASARPEDYLDSKRLAERLVRDSGVPAVLIRPSVVIGDSRTGVISRFQGLHEISTVLLRNLLPLMPMPATSRLDFVPCDVAARAIAALVLDRHRDGEVWITAGRAAPSIEALVDTAVTVGAELGIEVNRPRMVEPEMVDRLIRPVFIDPLPPTARRRFDDLLAMTALFVNAPVFPSTLGQLPRQSAALTAEQVTDAYRASLIYLAHTKKLAAPLSARVGAPA